jgi:hypothetical protein
MLERRRFGPEQQRVQRLRQKGHRQSILRGNRAPPWPANDERPEVASEPSGRLSRLARFDHRVCPSRAPRCAHGTFDWFSCGSPGLALLIRSLRREALLWAEHEANGGDVKATKAECPERAGRRGIGLGARWRGRPDGESPPPVVRISRWRRSARRRSRGRAS